MMEGMYMKLKWLLQILIILGFLLLGSSLVKILYIPLPGSVAGMMILFVFLLTGIIKVEWIEKVSTFQLKHLTLLFIPPVASLFISANIVEILQWNILVILFISSICCLLGTALSVEWYEKIKRRNGK